MTYLFTVMWQGQVGEVEEQVYGAGDEEPRIGTEGAIRQVPAVQHESRTSSAVWCYH